MSVSTESSQSKKSHAGLLNNLKLRLYLLRRKYATPTGAKQILISIVMYMLIIGLAFVFLYPFLYMIINSLMSNADLNSSSVSWIPTEFKFENYSIALDLMNIKRYAINSFTVTIIACIGHVISCSFIGYGFARYNFPLKNVLFGIVILAFIVPTQTIIIPLYLTYSNLKWLNTYLPLLVPTFFGFGLRGALYVFLFRQFYMTVPRSLEEAARIDGCGFMKTYWKIVFPLAKATLVVALVLSVVWHWNDSYEPGLYVDSPTLQFLPPRITTIIAAANALPDQQQEMLRQLGLEDGEDTLNNAVVMAGATIISAPVLLFFAFAQRQFMQGIERSGITGE
ncbi:MAG: carbohydrate ABC transporter permease [Lachnospiraceae bacterium]|nr:carbohydrate ABC transporter permease [Lachnospiraceae bacterium]